MMIVPSQALTWPGAAAGRRAKTAAQRQIFAAREKMRFLRIGDTSLFR
jgi:hypothetical protein